MADLDLNELERLEKAADILRNGRLSAGIAGNADLVAFDGNDVTGIARFDNPARAAYVAALCNALSELLRRLRAAEAVRGECHDAAEKQSGCFRAVAAERLLSAAQARIAELEAMRAATYSHVDGRDLLHELQPNGAHHIDIVVRINGQDRRYEGDWLKRLTHARDGHTMGEYADNPKVKAMIDAALAKGKP